MMITLVIDDRGSASVSLRHPVRQVDKRQAKKIRQQVADKKNVGEQGQCAHVLVVSS
jgi:hypothetical protein